MTKEGSQQRCCYDQSLNWIPSGVRGAGTPDKVDSLDYYELHNKIDVEPFKWCCRDCPFEDPSKKNYCDFYIKEVRKGPDACTSKRVIG